MKFLFNSAKFTGKVVRNFVPVSQVICSGAVKTYNYTKACAVDIKAGFVEGTKAPKKVTVECGEPVNIVLSSN